MPTPNSSTSAAERREQLKQVFAQVRNCVRCQELAGARKNVVFGAGDANADLMLIGEAPGASEDERGLPFVGRAGKLLATLLEEIGLTREDVFIANVLKCRPPGNRDPLPGEIENCREYLYRQVELIEPVVICSLGNFSTKLLREDPTGITRLHGRPEIVTLGRRAVRLYPIFHPAAALYTPRMLETLREDFARLPELLALGEPAQPDWGGEDTEAPEVGLAGQMAGSAAVRRMSGSGAVRQAPDPHAAPQAPRADDAREAQDPHPVPQAPRADDAREAQDPDEQAIDQLGLF